MKITGRSGLIVVSVWLVSLLVAGVADETLDTDYVLFRPELRGREKKDYYLYFHAQRTTVSNPACEVLVITNQGGVIFDNHFLRLETSSRGMITNLQVSDEGSSNHWRSPVKIQICEPKLGYQDKAGNGLPSPCPAQVRLVGIEEGPVYKMAVFQGEYQGINLNWQRRIICFPSVNYLLVWDLYRLPANPPAPCRWSILYSCNRLQLSSDLQGERFMYENGDRAVLTNVCWATNATDGYLVSGRYRNFGSWLCQNDPQQGLYCGLAVKYQAGQYRLQARQVGAELDLSLLKGMPLEANSVAETRQYIVAGIGRIEQVGRVAEDINERVPFLMGAVETNRTRAAEGRPVTGLQSWLYRRKLSLNNYLEHARPYEPVWIPKAEIYRNVPEGSNLVFTLMPSSLDLADVPVTNGNMAIPCQGIAAGTTP